MTTKQTTKKENKDGIDSIECALLELESFNHKNEVEAWAKPEMKELKQRCSDLDFGPSLYRAMVAMFNNWTSKAGRADINEIEQWQIEYENV